jgi:hypothetical protein
VFARGKEVERIEHFVGHWISEYIHTSAYCADRNKIVRIESYARLGRYKAPPDICSDSFDWSQVAGYCRADWHEQRPE